MDKIERSLKLRNKGFGHSTVKTVCPEKDVCMVLAEDQSLGPSTHIRWLTTAYNSSSRRPNTPWPSQLPMCTWYIQTHKSTHIHKMTFKNKSLKYKRRKLSLRTMVDSITTWDNFSSTTNIHSRAISLLIQKEIFREHDYNSKAFSK